MEKKVLELELFAEELPDQQSLVSLAGFTTAFCFACYGSASCPGPACVSSAGTFSSNGG